MPDAASSCGEPSVEQWFRNGFAKQADVSADAVATLVVRLASGAADVLSGRHIDVSDDVTQLVARAAEIDERDLYVLRERDDVHGLSDRPRPEAEP